VVEAERLSTMHAHQVVDLVGPAGLRWAQVPEPDPAEAAVIDVVAAGVSFADLLYSLGRYQVRPPLPFSPGMGASGVVRSAPRGAGVEPGQRVAVLAPHGCWQEVVAADPARLLPLPDDMAFEAGAAVPLNGLTALLALARRGRAEAGEVLLVHGAAGGVGAFAVRIGRALRLRTIAVVSDERKAAFARSCGADDVVSGAGWADDVRELVGDRGVNLTLDPVGGDRLVESLRLTAPEGRVLVVGFTAGEIPTVKVNRLLLGNLGVLGVGSRELFDREPSLIRDLWDRYLDLRGDSGPADPPIDVRPFADARQALEAVADRRVLGTGVLSRRTRPDDPALEPAR
jgi:NADPH2:quinone reductase